MSITEYAERFERTISAKILINNKEVIEPLIFYLQEASYEHSPAKHASCDEERKDESESEAKGSEDGAKSHGEGLESFQTLESNQGTFSLCLGGPRNCSRLRTPL